MALDYVFYAERNLVVLTGSGHLVAQDFKDYIHNFLCNNPQVKSGFLELGDFRAIESNDITIAEMREIVRMDGTLKRPHPSKFAFVVSDDANFGSVRQYAAHVQVENKEIMPFRSMDEAKTWLGIEDFEIK
jgi:hypothetical protein